MVFFTESTLQPCDRQLSRLVHNKEEFARRGEESDESQVRPQVEEGNHGIESSRLVLVFSSDRVGLRLSPLNSYNSIKDSDPIGTFTWLATRLNDNNLAYLHVMRADFLGEQQGDVLTPIREAYNGVLVGNTGYTAAEAEAAIADGQLDAIAFGVSFLANPDLPHRFAQNAPLNAPDPSKFYSPGAPGYTDYPNLAAA